MPCGAASEAPKVDRSDRKRYFENGGVGAGGQAAQSMVTGDISISFAF